MIRKVKAWLVKNHLTPDPSDYIAVVDSNGSVDIQDIVDELQKEGMEIKRETAIDIVSRYNRKCIDLAVSGYSVNTGIVLLRATVKGVFHDKTWNKELNKLHISVNQGIDLRQAVAETEVEILGEHGELIALFGITDLSTGKTNGTITHGFNAEIKGTYIKIAGDDPTVGVFMESMETGEVFRLPTSNIALNEPSRLLLLIPPDLRLGEYELRVTTQFSGSGKTLKVPRTAVMYTLLTVI
jgi:hypothetical protein